jgi:hypothetical protein
VRGNYTDEALLEFRYEYEFLEAMSECSDYITINGYDVRIDITMDGMEVYKENGEYVKTISDLDDLKELEEEEEEE